MRYNVDGVRSYRVFDEVILFLHLLFYRLFRFDLDHVLTTIEIKSIS